MFSAKIFSDFTRIFSILPAKLQRKTCISFGLITLQAIFELLTILLISFLAMVIISPESLSNHIAVRTVLEYIPSLHAYIDEPRFFATISAFFVVGIIIFKNIITAACAFHNDKLGSYVALYAGEVIFSNFLYSSYISHIAGQGSQFFTGLSWRTALGNMMVRLMNFYTYIIITLVLILALAFFVPPPVLLVLACLGIASIIIYRTFRNKVNEKGKEVAEFGANEKSATMNAMSGIREILIYNQQPVFLDYFMTACKESIAPKTYIALVPSFPVWILESLGFLSIPLSMIIMIVAYDASLAEITPVLTMIMLIAWRLLPMFNRSVSLIMSVQSFRFSAMECLEMLEKALQNSLINPVEPDPNFSFTKHITFQNVDFCYPNAKHNCLEDITFSVPCGKRLGIIGKTGAGKSSIVALLSGLIDPSAGQMLVDGKILSVSQRAAYCKSIGYVPQNPYILTGSLAENVAFCNWGKPWDEEKVLQVCAMAELEIAKTRGIDTWLKQGGIGLSGGQAQRVSIARALYASPSILIFDEATSALDTKIEKTIMDTIYALPQNITTIIIAHRLSTVERCDNILWVDEGMIRMYGEAKDVLKAYEKFLT